MYKILVKSSIFQGFSENEIQEVLSHFHFQVVRYNKGKMLHLCGDEVSSLMIVIHGCVRGEILDPSGKVFNMEEICSPNIIAPGFIYGNSTKFPVNVVAVEDSEVLYIPKEDFSNLLASKSQVLNNFLDVLSSKTQHLALKIKCIFLQKIEGKIASYLLELSELHESKTFELTKSQEWMAQRFNVARPSIARVFADLKSKEYIQVEDRKITILDAESLEQCINKL